MAQPRRRNGTSAKRQASASRDPGRSIVRPGGCWGYQLHPIRYQPQQNHGECYIMLPVIPGHISSTWCVQRSSLNDQWMGLGHFSLNDQIVLFSRRKKSCQSWKSVRPRPF